MFARLLLKNRNVPKRLLYFPMSVLLSLSVASLFSLVCSADNFKIQFSVAVNTVFCAVSLKFTDIVLLVIPPHTIT